MIAACYLQFSFFHLVRLLLKQNMHFCSASKYNVTTPMQLELLRDLDSI